MPTYRGQLSEEEIIQLIRYIGSLKQPAGEPLPAGKPADRPAESPPSRDEGAR